MACGKRLFKSISKGLLTKLYSKQETGTPFKLTAGDSAIDTGVLALSGGGIGVSFVVGSAGGGGGIAGGMAGGTAGCESSCSVGGGGGGGVGC